MTGKTGSPIQDPNRRPDSEDVVPAPVTPEIPAASVPGPTIAEATAALSAACRDLAASLAAMTAHAEAAVSHIGRIGATADALAKTGVDLKDAADSLKDDYLRTAKELQALGHDSPARDHEK